MKDLLNKIEELKTKLLVDKPNNFTNMIDELNNLQAIFLKELELAENKVYSEEDKRKAERFQEKYNYATNVKVDDSHKYTIVLSDGYVGPGGAFHNYLIVPKENARMIPVEICFQDGPIKEAGVNGVMDENLLAIVISRLNGFQSGPYACPQNQEALEAAQRALAVLQERTKIRESAGVEGTHQVGPETKESVYGNLQGQPIDDQPKPDPQPTIPGEEGRGPYKAPDGEGGEESKLQD